VFSSDFGRLQPVIVTEEQIYPVLHPTDVGTDREEPYGFGALIGLAEAMRRAKRAVNSPAECNFIVKRAGHACRSAAAINRRQIRPVQWQHQQR
jgi:hypothetical protein